MEVIWFARWVYFSSIMSLSIYRRLMPEKENYPLIPFWFWGFFSETTHNFYHYLCTASWKELPSQWVWTGCFTRVDYVFMNNASEFQAQCLIHSKSLLINKRKNWQLCFSKNKGKDRATWVREETDCCHYSATLMDHLVVSRKADQTYSDDL